VPAIAELWLSFQREHNARFIRQVRVTKHNRERIVEHFGKLVGNRQLWAVAADGALVGFAAIAPNRHPIDLFYASAAVSDLYLLPAWRGRGWGRALLERVVADIEARGLHAVTISYLAGNPAGDMYESSGFRPFSHMLIRPLVEGMVKTGPEYPAEG
jgi:GNAT superfamily N-acetyltransferase